MLRTQQEAKKNRVSVFGRFMPDLLRKVDEADRLNRFNKKPRGPFGEFWVVYIISFLIDIIGGKTEQAIQTYILAN